MKSIPVVAAAFLAVIQLCSAQATPAIPFPSERLSPFLSANLDAITAPFGGPGFGKTQAIIDLHESFADQMAQAAPSVKPMYQAAMNVCEEMAAAIQEREDAVAGLSGSMAVHGGSALGAIRKVNVHDWKDWLEQQREKRENKARARGAAKTDAFFTSAQQVQWKQRSLQLKQRIQQSYERERQAERVVLSQLAAATPPPQPAAAAAPTTVATTVPPPAKGAAATPPATHFSEKDFHDYVCKYVWAWQPQGKGQAKVRQSTWFDPSGVVSSDNWSGSFYTTGLHSLTIQRGKLKTNLTFSDDYSTYKGSEEGGSNFVTGYILR